MALCPCKKSVEMMFEKITPDMLGRNLQVTFKAHNWAVVWDSLLHTWK